MATAGRTRDERMNVFQVGEQYLFKQYFDGDVVFAPLSEYYNGS